MTDRAAVPEDLRARTRRLLNWQIVTGLGVAAGFYLGGGGWAALSAVYGGALSIMMVLLLSFSIVLAGQAASRDPGQGQWILYAGAGVRFVLALILFGIGLAAIGLLPVAMIAGFAAVQLVFLAAAKSR